MWASLIGTLLSVLLPLFLPLIKKWLDQLFTALDNSPTAKKLLRTANPQNVTEFEDVYAKMLDAAIDDAKPNAKRRRWLQWAKKHALKPKVVRATWNHTVTSPKMLALGLPTAEDSMVMDLVNEANADVAVPE